MNPQKEFDAFDSLPRSVRHELNDSVCGFDASDILSKCNKHGEAWTIKWIRSSDNARMRATAFHATGQDDHLIRSTYTIGIEPMRNGQPIRLK